VNFSLLSEILQAKLPTQKVTEINCRYENNSQSKSQLVTEYKLYASTNKEEELCGCSTLSNE